MTPIASARGVDPDRPEEWREELGAAFSLLAPEAVGIALPDGWLTAVRLGSIGTYEVSGTPQVLRRTPAAVRAEPTEHLKLCLPVRGRATVHQTGDEVVVEPGQMALYDTARPYDIRLDGDWRCAVVSFRRNALALPRNTMRRILMQPFEVADGSGAVLADFVVSATKRCGALGSAAAERLGEATLHLIAGAVSETSLAVDEAADAMRIRVLNHVRAHLDDPNLSHARVAAAHGIAPRTLTRLFEDEPATVAEYIRVCRLEAVRRDLVDPGRAHRTIAALAARWCFTDQAHFSRAFRAHFGITPSDARRADR